MPVARLKVRLTPRAHAEAIEIGPDDALKAWVRAAPTDGQANEALIRLLAKRLAVAPSKIAIVKGHSARTKEIEVQNLSVDQCLKRLNSIL